MALQTISYPLMAPHLPTVSWSGNSVVLDNAADRIAWIVKAPKTGSIDRISFRTGTVTTSESVSVGIYTVDASGDPTSTAYGGMTAGAQATLAANTTYEVTLGTAASATIGDTIAIVVQFTSAVGNLQIISNWSGGATSVFPYCDNNTAAAWAKVAGGAVPTVSVRYSDAAYYGVGGLPACNGAGQSFNTGSTPDEIGNIINVPFACRVWGFWLVADIDNAADVVLYDTNGTTVLRTVSIVPAERTGTGTGLYYMPFTTTQDLAINSSYRIVLKPTTGSNVQIQRMTVLAAGHMDMAPLGQECYETSRADAGAWTNTTTQRVSIGLLIDGLSDNVGGGGLSANPVGGFSA